MNTEIFIKGEKIFLRTLTKKDIYAGWWEWFNDKEITRYLNKGHEKNTVAKQIEFFQKTKNSNSDFILGICDSQTEKHIGTTGIHNIQESDGKCGDFGIVIGKKEYWNQGIGAEAWYLMVKYAFNSLNLDSIETRVFVDNKASLKIAQKLGFKILDILKKDVIKNGTEIDRLLLRLDKDFWHKNIEDKIWYVQ